MITSYRNARSVDRNTVPQATPCCRRSVLTIGYHHILKASLNREQLRTVVKKVDFSYMPIGQPSLKTRSPPRRRPNSARRLRPGFAPGNTERVPVQATPRVSYHPPNSRTGLGLRLRFPSRCCAASAGLSCPEIAPQYVHTCFTRFLTGTVKATCTPLPTGQTHRRGMRSEQLSKRRASTKAAA